YITPKTVSNICLVSHHLTIYHLGPVLDPAVYKSFRASRQSKQTAKFKIFIFLFCNQICILLYKNLAISTDDRTILYITQLLILTIYVLPSFQGHSVKQRNSFRQIIILTPCDDDSYKEKSSHHKNHFPVMNIFRTTHHCFFII